MSKNKVVRKINEVKNNGVDCRLNIRLSKNGQFSSVSGKVQGVKVNLDGRPYVVVKGGKHEFQSVPLDNVLAVVVDGEVVKR